MPPWVRQRICLRSLLFEFIQRINLVSSPRDLLTTALNLPAKSLDTQSAAARYTHTQRPRRTRRHTLTHADARRHTQVPVRRHSQRRTYTHVQTLRHTHTRSHAYTHTHAHTHAHTRTDVDTQVWSFSSLPIREQGDSAVYCSF